MTDPLRPSAGMLAALAAGFAVWAAVIWAYLTLPWQSATSCIAAAFTFAALAMVIAAETYEARP